MASNQRASGLNWAIKPLVVEKYKLCEIYQTTCDLCRENFLVKNVYKWAKSSKERRNTIQEEVRLGRITMMSTPEMVDSLNVLIERRITINDNSVEQRISVGTAKSLIHWISQGQC